MYIPFEKKKYEDIPDDFYSFSLLSKQILLTLIYDAHDEKASSIFSTITKIKLYTLWLWNGCVCLCFYAWTNEEQIIIFYEFLMFYECQPKQTKMIKQQQQNKTK